MPYGGFPIALIKELGVLLLNENPQVFYCPHPAIITHSSAEKALSLEGQISYFPFFPSLAPRACCYGVGLVQKFFSWEGPLLRLNFWSMVVMMKNGRAEHLYQGWKHWFLWWDCTERFTIPWACCRQFGGPVCILCVGYLCSIWC